MPRPMQHVGHEAHTASGQAGKQVGTSEERFRLVFDSLPSPCAIYDADRRFRFVNRSMLQLIRCSAEEMIGNRDENVVPRQATDLYVPLLCRAIETRSPQRAECTFAGPLGILHYITNFVPLLDGQGSVLEVLGISYDITQQKHIEQQLQRRDRELRSLADNVPDIIARVDRAGRHLFVNRCIEAMTGIPWQAFLGKTDRELGMPTDLVDLWDENREQVFITGQPLESEFRCQTPDAPHQFERRLIPEFGPDESVESVLTIVRDITDRKLAEMQLSESEERFRLAFEAAPIGMVLIGMDGRLLKVNSAFCRIVGYSEEECGGMTIMQLTHPLDIAGTDDRLRQLRDGGSTLDTKEKRYVAKGGRTVWARVTSAAVHDRNGQRLYGLAQIEDITASRAATQELERYRDHLEEMVRSRTRALEASQQTLRSAERLASLGTLSAGIAHEINNPVGTILLAAEMAMAAKVSRDDELLDRCLAGIREDAQRCGRIVKNVLHFARQEPSDKWPHRLNDVVSRAVDRARALAASRNATIKIEIDSQVESVLMNPIAIEQALGNILRNAIESRAERVSVTVSTSVAGPCYAVTIKDDGPGIPADVQSQIFDPFFTERRAEGRMGLGLSLAHGTVSDHQAQIHVDSTPGQGTSFTIEFPPFKGS